MALVDAHSLVMVSSSSLSVHPKSPSLLSHEILPPSPSPTGFSRTPAIFYYALVSDLTNTRNDVT